MLNRDGIASGFEQCRNKGPGIWEQLKYMYIELMYINMVPLVLCF